MNNKPEWITRERLEGVLEHLDIKGVGLRVENETTVGISVSVDGLRGFPSDPDGNFTLVMPIALSGLMTDAGMVEAIVHGALVCLMHELQEQVTYRGEMIVNPHEVGSIYPTEYAVRGLIRELPEETRDRS